MSKIAKNNNPNNKLISIVSPCFNEEHNIIGIYNGVSKIMKKQPYKYEHIFIDNCSTEVAEAIDKVWDLIDEIKTGEG